MTKKHEPIVEDNSAEQQSDYIVVDGVLTLRRDHEAAQTNTEGVTIVPAHTEENTNG